MALELGRGSGTALVLEGQTMPNSKLRLLLHAEELRARAEEVSAQADAFKDADSQQKMRDVADLYEDLAQRMEQHAGDREKQ